MAKKRMVAGWPCWFWMDADGVIQQFGDQKAPRTGRKGWVLKHDDASLYDLAEGLVAPWLNHDGTTRLLMRPIPVNDVEPVRAGVEFLADAPDGGHAPGDDEESAEAKEFGDWADLEAEIEAEEKAKAKK